MAIIRNAEEFLQKVQVGTTFWHLTCFCGKPTGVAGPFTVLRFSQDSVESNQVHYSRKPYSYEKGDSRESSSYVADITNEWMGVFLSEEEAEQFFAKDLVAFESDPERLAEYKEESDECDELMDMLNDSLLEEEWENAS